MSCPSLVLSIDPGIRGCGAALWHGRKLVAATYVKNPIGKGSGPLEALEAAHAVAGWVSEKSEGYRTFPPTPLEVVVEWPQTYGGRASRGDTNDLFALSAVDTAIVALLEPSKTHFYVPREWKGALQKPASVNDAYPVISMASRRLDEEETKAIALPTNKRLTWDVWDAIGIGLKYLGRFEKMKVYARD